MANGSEVTKKVKDAIKAKLVELGAYVDDELPDYVMVLVANKKNKDQMDEDLSLFLGHNTERFTSWLHEVLQKLNAAASLQTQPAETPASKKRDSELKERLELKKEKSEKRKEKKEKKKKKNKKDKSNKKNDKKKEKSSEVSLAVPKDDSTVLLVNDEVPDKKSESNGIAVSLLPMQNEIDILDIQTDPHDLSLEVSDEEPIISVSPPKKLIRTIHQNVAVIEEPESHKKETTPIEKKMSIRDRLGIPNSEKRMIKLKEETSLPLKSTIEVKPGIGRVLSSSIASAVRSVTQTDRSGRVQTKLEARVKPLMSERIKRRASDSEDEMQPKKSIKLTSVVRPVKSHEPPKASGVVSKVEVTPRPRRTGSGQANTALIMRAVADANKSMNRPLKRSADELTEEAPVAKRKQIFTKGYKDQMKDSEEPKVRKIAITVPNAHAQLSPVLDEDSLDEKLREQSGDEAQSEELVYELKEPLSPETPSDHQTRFFIAMDGMPDKNVKGRLGSGKNSSLDGGCIEEVEEWEEVEEASLVAETPEPVKKEENPVQQKVPIILAKKEGKCKFWPDCKDGETCRFIHPKKCMMFPNCKFGSKCLYTHPRCKFDSTCTKAMCPFSHTSKPAAPSLVSNIKCRFYPKCTDMNCQFMHPKQICRFGNFCKMVNCAFIHPEVTYGSKLKWSAPKTTEKPTSEETVKS